MVCVGVAKGKTGQAPNSNDMKPQCGNPPVVIKMDSMSRIAKVSKPVELFSIKALSQSQWGI